MLEAGFLSFINLIIILSITIGLINLFPLPVLDGGHLLFYIIEGIIGKPINENIQNNQGISLSNLHRNLEGKFPMCFTCFLRLMTPLRREAQFTPP